MIGNGGHEGETSERAIDPFPVRIRVADPHMELWIHAAQVLIADGTAYFHQVGRSHSRDVSPAQYRCLDWDCSVRCLELDSAVGLKQVELPADKESGRAVQVLSSLDFSHTSKGSLTER